MVWRREVRLSSRLMLAYIRTASRPRRPSIPLQTMGKVTSFISCSVAIFVLINNGGRGVEANPIKPGDDPNLASLYTWGHYDDVHVR